MQDRAVRHLMLLFLPKRDQRMRVLGHQDTSAGKKGWGRLPIAGDLSLYCLRRRCRGRPCLCCRLLQNDEDQKDKTYVCTNHFSSACKALIGPLTSISPPGQTEACPDDEAQVTVTEEYFIMRVCRKTYLVLSWQGHRRCHSLFHKMESRRAMAFEGR